MLNGLNFLQQYSGVLLKGFTNTVLVCVIGIILGMIIGAIVCVIKLAPFKFFRIFTDSYIEFFRGTPFLIQVYILYYVGPQFGLELNALSVGIIGIALYGGAYFAEIYRGGYLSVPQGQIEASRALGLGSIAIVFRIVIPQMLILILAPITNQTITLIKDSAILSVITLEELTFAGQRVIGETFKYVDVYAMVALMYWLIITTLSVLSTRLESVLKRYMKVKTS